MTRDEVLAQLAPVFQDVFDDEDLQPTPDLTADDVEEWDSLSHIRLVVSVEQAFSIRFDTAEIEELKNVGEFADLVVLKLS